MKAEYWQKDKSINIAKGSEVSNFFMVKYDTHDVAGSFGLLIVVVQTT